MGELALFEQASPATPDEGVVFYSTIATPSIAKVKDDAAGDYTLALLEKVQTFATTQIVSPTSTVSTGLRIAMPASATGLSLDGQYNGTSRFTVLLRADRVNVNLESFDNGNSIGPSLFVGRNSNGSTPAPGCIIWREGDDSAYATLYPDNSAVFRTFTAEPTSANIGSGTIIGTQTSFASAKLISDDLSELGEVMARISQGAAAVRRFVYRDGRFGKEEFEGVVTDAAPAYGYDRDDAHPQGKALNEIVIAGDLLRFAAWAIERIEKLSRRVVELETTWAHYESKSVH